MGSTVIVNNMTVVHADSGGMSQIFPDVCKTPAPPAPVPPPIPYPNIAKSSDTASGSSTVKCDGKAVMIKSSNFKMSMGDEAGAAMGVVSSKIKGKAEPKLFSMDVKFDGENVMRLSDIMLQNIGSAPNTPPGTEVQAPAAAAGGDAKPKDPEIPEVTRMEWKTGKVVCGDKVNFEVDTKNIPMDINLAVKVQRQQAIYQRKSRAGRPNKPVHDTMQVKISGNKGNHEWLARQWRWGKEITVNGLQELYKGVQKSNDLKMDVVPEVGQEKVPVTPTPDPTRFIIWDAGFYAEIKKGQFIVTRKIHFRDGTKNPVPGARPDGRMKRKLKKQCEKVWSKKWKLHRTACQRKDDCDCSSENGCCTFIIHVVVEWAAGFQPVGWNPGPNAAGGWAPWVDFAMKPIGPNDVGPGWVWQIHYFDNPDFQKWWYSHEWWEGRVNLGNAAAVAAHEFGHLLGLHDEYTGGANLFDPINKVPVPAFANVPDSIMGSGWKTFDRHFGDIKKWFDGKTSVLGGTKLIQL